MVTPVKVKTLLIITVSYYSFDKDYDNDRQLLNAKVLHLNLCFLFEDAIQIFMQYFFSEKFALEIDWLTIANSTIMLLMALLSCTKVSFKGFVFIKSQRNAHR